MALISVLMPNFNKARFIREAIASITNQSFQDWELIIADDGSDDGSWELIEEAAAADKRIKAFRCSHMGLISIRNFALSKVSGEFIAALDSDDWSYPERFSKQLAYMEEHPDCGVLGSDYEVIDEQGTYIESVSQPLLDEEIRRSFFFFNPIRHSSIFFRRACVLELGAYSPDWFAAEDLEILMRFGTKWKLANLSDKLIKYRIFSSNFSHQQQRAMIRSTLRLRCYAAKRLNYQWPRWSRLAYVFTSLMLFIPPTRVQGIFSWIRRNFKLYAKG
jgi:glycosyltransferase involved in cell wall biosynthesis